MAAENGEEWGNRMKAYEKATTVYLNPHQPFMMRLDGHCFSTFTKSFRRPFDDRISYAMIETTADLLSNFPSATAAYTESDEITLVFPSLAMLDDMQAVTASQKQRKRKRVEPILENMPFKGKVGKITTLAAGLCSSRFTYHLASVVLDADLREKCYRAHFDARIFNVPAMEETISNLKWRVRDSRRNSKMLFARKFFSPKELHAVRSTEAVKMVWDCHQVSWHDLPGRYKGGVVIKTLVVEKEGKDFKTGEPIVFNRKELRIADWDDLEKISEERGEEEFAKLIGQKNLDSRNEAEAEMYGYFRTRQTKDELMVAIQNVDEKETLR